MAEKTSEYPEINDAIRKNKTETSSYIKDYFYPHFNLY